MDKGEKFGVLCYVQWLMLSVWGASDKGVIGCVRVHMVNGGYATWVSILSTGNNLLISSLKKNYQGAH